MPPTKTDFEPDTNWAVTAFDPWDSRIDQRNVWGMYRAMRERGPAVHSAAHGGYWLLTTYDAVRAAAADHSVFSSGNGVLIGKPRREVPSKPLELDRPEHTVFRKVMQGPFLSRRVEELTEVIRATVDELLDGLADKVEFDIVSDLVEPIPRRLISHILGMPDGEMQDRFATLAMNRIHAAFSQFEQAQREYFDFLRFELVEAIDARGRHGFIGELLDMSDTGEMDREEVPYLAAALASAGYGTSIHAIASLLLRMAEEKPRRAYLRDPLLEDGAVEEALRLDPPIHLEGRTTTAPVVVGDVEIPRGAQVALVYASANRDEGAFPEPDRFDLGRDHYRHLSFGHGIHKCLGAPLARIEMHIVLEQMMRRFPEYRITAEPAGSRMVHGHHMGWERIPAAIG